MNGGRAAYVGRKVSGVLLTVYLVAYCITVLGGGRPVFLGDLGRLGPAWGGLELVAITQDVGTAREQIEGDYSGSPLTVAFNAQYLIEGVEVAAADRITLSTIDELKPALVKIDENEEFLYLLMPVRVS